VCSYLGTMNVVTGVVGAVTGLVTGPWLRAITFRLSVPAGQADRTVCPACGSTLLASRSWWRSTLCPTGRCAACHTRVGAPAGVLEVAAAALLGTLAALVGPHPELAALSWLALLGVTLAAIDLRVHRLPDRLTLPAYPVVALLFALAAVINGEPGRLVRTALCGVALAACYLTLVLLRPDDLGAGDVKLAGLLGMALGWFGWNAVVVGTAVAFVLCATAGVALLISRRGGLRSALPLGPFMVTGAYLVVFVASA
jgi:leader peptidase (prepilin peptidase)/N-methyltransferase